jgi:elongation factor G
MPDAVSNGTRPPAPPRAIALIGPQGSGKSTLFDALLAAAGTPMRRTGGGATARERVMGTEMRLGHATYLGDPWAILDCPGSVEFLHETAAALAAVDLAVLVCEPSTQRASSLAPFLRMIEAEGMPGLIFVNKIDTLGEARVRDTLSAMQAHSRRPLVLRQVPIRQSDGSGAESIAGYVDLVSERAFRYRRGAPSELIRIPTETQAREAEARAALAEALADHDDELLEKLLEDAVPSPEELYRVLHHDLTTCAVDEVLLGAAEREHGIRRLWKALRHDTPPPDVAAARRGVPEDAEAPLAQVVRTIHAGQGGRLSLARIWRGPLRDSTTLEGVRIGGIQRFPGGEPTKVPEAVTGELVALGRLEGIATGRTLCANSGAAPALPFPEPPAPVFALAIATEDRKDDVRLSAALAKLMEEDPALGVVQDAEQGQTLLTGQGELHLNAALGRLQRIHGLKVSTTRPRVPYRETIRQHVRQHGRLKRQTGGHGQYADVTLEVTPRRRGEGFLFEDRIVGGAVPRKFIPAVAEAAEEAMRKGPLGNPVVDVAVALVDGGFHSVDSSDMAFASATRQTLQEALAKAGPVLLEPVHHVVVTTPEDATPAVQRLLTTRRGQIMGYAAKDGWPGWDEVQAKLPAAELQELILELRAATQGLASYTHEFDHLAEAPASR